jgi:hypothetical protein
VADSLDVVSVRIQDVRAVVVRVIPAHSQRPVVGSACLERRSVERVDRLAVVYLERDVQPTPYGTPVGLNPERSLSIHAEASGLSSRLHEETESKGSESFLIAPQAEPIVEAHRLAATGVEPAASSAPARWVATTPARTATPIAPPIWTVVLSSPEAMPAAASSTAPSAAVVIETNEKPAPNATVTIAGSTCVQ